MSLSYKVIKASKTTIDYVVDEASDTRVYPSDVNLSNELTDYNIQCLSATLDLLTVVTKKPKLFDFLNDINYDKKGLIDDPTKAPSFPAYQSFHILSHERDCLFYVNEVNLRPSMSDRAGYKYLMGSIRKRKRYIKVPKAYADEDKQILQEVYNLSKNELDSYYSMIIKIHGCLPDEIKTAYNEMNNNNKLITNE